MNYTVVITGAVWLGSLTYYFIDAHKWFTGPKITIDAGDLSEEQKVAIREENLNMRDTSEEHGNFSGSDSRGGKEAMQVTETVKSDSSTS